MPDRFDRLPTASAIGAVVFLVCVGCAGIVALRPPAPLPAGTGVDQFSAERALAHVAAIARVPHPTGSAAGAAPREYIRRQFAEAGLEIEEQHTTVARRIRETLVAARLHNLAARLPGTSGGQALMLAAHSDSAPAAPGASDDAHGVAVLLETLRALRAGPRLRNDVLFLVTDGEELGLLGAVGFLEDHPWRRRAGLVLNFEARGTDGPAWMFRTSPANGWLVREFAKAAPWPAASSMAAEILRLLPNDTDFSEFQRFGLAGFDFAYFDTPGRYHTALDSVANLNRGSLQNAGSNALALARHFGNLDLNAPVQSEVAYYGTPHTPLVVYPVAWVKPLAGLAVALFLLAIGLGIRGGRVTPGGFAVGLAVSVLLPVGAFGIGWLADPAIHTEQDVYAGYYAAGLRQLAWSAFAVALASAVYVWLLGKTSLANLWLSALGLWMLLNGALAWFAPGSSIVFIWPLLFALAAALWRACSDAADRRGLAVVCVLSIPALLLIPQITDVLYAAIPLNGTGAGMALVVLLAGTLVPVWGALARRGRWWLPGVACAVWLACLVDVTWRSRFDAGHPRPDHLALGVDADSHQTRWLSLDDATDGYTAGVFGATPARAAAPRFFPFYKEPLLQAPAPAADLPGPLVQLIGDRREGDVREVEIEFRAQRPVAALSLYFDSGVQIAGGSIDGKAIDLSAGVGRSRQVAAPPQRWRLNYVGLPAAGARAVLRLRGAEGRLGVLAVDQSYGVSAPPRPPGFMEWPFAADATLVSKQYEFR